MEEQVGTERVTNIFQRQWEEQEDRRVDLQPKLYRYNTVLVASLDEDGLRCGKSLLWFPDPHADGCPTPEGGLAGKDARCPWLRKF